MHLFDAREKLCKEEDKDLVLVLEEMATSSQADKEMEAALRETDHLDEKVETSGKETLADPRERRLIQADLSKKK